ncbi:hypothetical protein [Vampirovibrio chlorellavorus]|uniref:hypothetical protein n=1 Tax=Vampirovibrio chlorellavorus TaxID=758823 RepID=UPI0026F06DD0|nr:hypothetical protein [Vampirovibrio chlorellavorus]
MWDLLKKIFLALSYAAQLLIVVGFGYLFLVNLKPTTAEILQAQQIAKSCPGLVFAGDVLASAQQMGRLDYVSLALTMLGVVIAILALSGFWVLRRETLETAKEHCSHLLKEKASTLTEHEVRKYLDGNDGLERFEAIVEQRLSAIMENEALVAKLVERLAPLIQKENLDYEQDFGTGSIDDAEIAKILQELAREDNGES